MARSKSVEKPVLIECTIRRKKGTTPTLEGETYDFQPVAPDGPHVAPVTNPAHIARFLSIPTFRRYEPDVPKPKPKPNLPPAQLPSDKVSEKELFTYAAQLGIKRRNKGDFLTALTQRRVDAQGHYSLTALARRLYDADHGEQSPELNDDYADLPREELELRDEDLGEPQESPPPIG